MKRIYLLCFFLLLSSAAFAEEPSLWLLTFKDKGTTCGYYFAKGDRYCKNVGGGEVCWQKADVVKTTKVAECEDSGGGFAAGAFSQGSGGTSYSSAPATKKYSGTESGTAADLKRQAESSRGRR